MKKNLINGFSHIHYQRPQLTDEELLHNSREFYNAMDSRRTVRDFDTRPVSLEVMKNIIPTAGTAP